MKLRIITDKEDFEIDSSESFELSRCSEENPEGDFESPTVKATVERIDETTNRVLDSIRIDIPSNMKVVVAGEDVVCV